MNEVNPFPDSVAVVTMRTKPFLALSGAIGVGSADIGASKDF